MTLARPLMLATWLMLLSVTLRAEVDSVDSPFYGGVLFDFYQQNYFSAVVGLEKEMALGRLGEDEAAAQTLLGSLYLSYGLHRRAQSIFERLLARHADPLERDLAWFYLAKIQYQRGLFQAAARHLDNIAAPLADGLEDERLTLRALVALRLGEPARAIEWLSPEAGRDPGLGFTGVNLALAYIDGGEQAKGMALLQTLARLPARDEHAAALVDRVNTALGFQYLEREQFAQARQHFERVQLQGPFSNRALLGLGWAAFGLGQPAAAVSAWRELAGREVSDTAVLEAYLALPYLAYEHGHYADALAQYQRAIQIYEDEIAAIDSQLGKPDFGAVIQALVAGQRNHEMGWQWQGEVLAGPLLKRYMLELVAGHAFQEGLKNYRDLLFVAQNLDHWRGAIQAYRQVMDVKEAAYAELRPRAQRRLRALEAQDHSGAIRALRSRVGYVELDQEAMALTSAAEEAQLQRLRSIEYRLSYNLSELGDKLDHLNLVDRSHALLDKHDLLAGLLKWEVMTSYKARLWAIKKELTALEAADEESARRRRDIRRILQAIPTGFDEQRRRLAGIERRLDAAAAQTDALRADHEAQLSDLIRRQLLTVRQTLSLYRSQALLSVAHIYDINLGLPSEAP